MPETLYQVQDVARMFGVGSSAVSNWRRRKSGPFIPEAAYTTKGGEPLWTAEQMRDMLAEHVAAAETVLEGSTA